MRSKPQLGRDRHDSRSYLIIVQCWQKLLYPWMPKMWAKIKDLFGSAVYVLTLTQSTTTATTSTTTRRYSYYFSRAAVPKNGDAFTDSPSLRGCCPACLPRSPSFLPPPTPPSVAAGQLLLLLLLLLFHAKATFALDSARRATDMPPLLAPAVLHLAEDTASGTSFPRVGDEPALRLPGRRRHQQRRRRRRWRRRRPFPLPLLPPPPSRCSASGRPLTPLRFCPPLSRPPLHRRCGFWPWVDSLVAGVAA